MRNTLAADAADVELSEWDIDETLHDAVEDDSPNPLAVRDALLALAAIEREAKQIETLKRQIVERYDDRKQTLAGRANAIRGSLQGYCERFGKLTLPDVGGIHLTTRNKGGKAKVVDLVEFDDYLANVLPDVKKAATETIERLDATRALELALDELGVHVHPSGTLVNADGEILNVPGVEVEPESKSLAVRKS